jgi:hypothetical protein
MPSRSSDRITTPIAMTAAQDQPTILKSMAETVLTRQNEPRLRRHDGINHGGHRLPSGRLAAYYAQLVELTLGWAYRATR